MTSTRWAAVVLSASALAFGACGGDDEDSGGGAATTGGGGGAQTEQASAGKSTFASTCGGCHTLSAAGTNGEVGPNLDDLKPDEETVLSAIERGPGVMPENLLQGAKAEEVAKYVAENAGS